jgi:hypothetical protein
MAMCLHRRCIRLPCPFAFAIAEPFNASNTAHSIYDETVFAQIKRAFTDAYIELESTRDLHTLLDAQPIRGMVDDGGRFAGSYAAVVGSSRQFVIANGNAGGRRASVDERDEQSGKGEKHARELLPYKRGVLFSQCQRGMAIARCRVDG